MNIEYNVRNVINYVSNDFYKNHLKSQTHKNKLTNQFKKFHLIKFGLYLSSM